MHLNLRIRRQTVSYQYFLFPWDTEGKSEKHTINTSCLLLELLFPR